MRRIHRDENGYIVVETTCSFMLFVLLVVSILSIINIVTVQTRVHYAITQAAEMLSMYSYTLDVTGVAGHMVNNATKADEVRGEIDEMKGSINGVIDAIENLSPNQVGVHGQAALDQAKGWADQAASDPKAMVQLMLNYGLNELGNAALEQVLRPLVGHYLTNGTVSGDDYLKSYRVIGGLDGLDFYRFTATDLSATGNQSSTLLTSNGDVKIVVQYDVDYTFGALLIPFAEPKLHITQEVLTKAWLKGLGEGYKK